jgi:hypothetical protein
MNDIYKILKPVFTNETMTSAIRQAGLIRQRHLLAALREDPPSVELAMSTMKVQHMFLAELCKAFTEENVPSEVCDGLGFHSLMFFGINPRLFEISVLAVSGAEEYSLERFQELISVKPDTQAIVAGEEFPVDTLMWLRHMGNSFAAYLVKCAA